MKYNSDFNTHETSVTFSCFADARNFIMESRLEWDSDDLTGINLIHGDEYIVFLSFKNKPNEDDLEMLTNSHNGNLTDEIGEKEIKDILQNDGAISVGDASLIMFACKTKANYEPLIKEALRNSKMGMTAHQISDKLNITINTAFPSLMKLERQNKVKRRLMHNGRGAVFSWIEDIRKDECLYIH